ncbi:hypothetical protein HYQ46_007431 [Verticillium longisporum]|nr:hypothetical protein HYQ46_007431 [Verticillium longisporum]
MAYQDQVGALAKDESLLQRNSQSSDQKRIVESNKDNQHAQSGQPTPVIASGRQRKLLQTTLVTEFLKPAAISEYHQGNLKRQNADDDNDVDYPLTITDPNWQWGNPTAIDDHNDHNRYRRHRHRPARDFPRGYLYSCLN